MNWQNHLFLFGAAGIVWVILFICLIVNLMEWITDWVNARENFQFWEKYGVTPKTEINPKEVLKTLGLTLMLVGLTYFIWSYPS